MFLKISSARRFHLVLLLGVCLMLSLVAVQAQDAVSLVADEPTSSSLDETTVARFFRLNVPVEGDVQIDLTSDELAVAVVLTGDDGATIAQVVDSDVTGSVSISESLEAGTYTLVVFAAPGSDLSVGSFEVVYSVSAVEIEASATPAPEETEEATPEATSEATIAATEEVTEEATEEPTEESADATPEATDEDTDEPASDSTWTEPTQVLLANGIEVTLSWDAAVDLGLEVRDPVGNTLYWDSRTSPIGGSFGFDANGLCEVISENPSETASWVPGFLPTGSYEILVFYRQACEESAPAAFTINVSVDGVALPTVEGALPPPPSEDIDSVYIASFNVSADGTAQLYDGDTYPDTSLNFLPASVESLIADATPITLGETLNGALYREQPYLSYSFDAQENDVVSIDLSAISGNLDTLLQLMNANGSILQVIDDSPGTTNSQISNVRLVDGGTYYIIATRYGKELGGTEGEFALSLTEGVAFTPTDITELGFPVGAISVLLTWNTNADLQLLVRDPVGDSVFDDTPQITSGGQLVDDGNVNCTVSDGSPTSYIYWPEGLLRSGIYEVDVWYQNSCNDATAVEFTLTVLVNGVPLIQEVQNPLPDQHFLVTFTIGPDGQPTSGLGGFITNDTTGLDYTNDTPVSVSLNSPVTGTISPTNAYDVYAFDGTAGQTISIAMNAVSQTLDTKLLLIAPSGIQVAENDDADPLLVTTNTGRTTNSLIASYTLQETGQYIIIATRYGIQFGGTIGAYSLTVQG